MRKIFLVLSVLSVAASTGTFAQAQQHSGTEEEQKACARDVTRFCRKVMDQGDLIVLSCLKENRSKLTPACNAVLVNHGQ